MYDFNIKDKMNNEVIQDAFFLKEFKVEVAKNKKEYANVLLMNKNGTYMAKLWDLDEDKKMIFEKAHIKQAKSITIDSIQDIVSSYFNLRVQDFKSQKRTRNVAYPRQIAMYLSRKLTDMSLPKIGEEFGGRDHTTVIHAYEKISENLKTDEGLQSTIDDITKKLKQI